MKGGVVDDGKIITPNQIGLKFAAITLDACYAFERHWNTPMKFVSALNISIVLIVFINRPCMADFHAERDEPPAHGAVSPSPTIENLLKELDKGEPEAKEKATLKLWKYRPRLFSEFEILKRYGSNEAKALVDEFEPFFREVSQLGAAEYRDRETAEQHVKEKDSAVMAMILRAATEDQDSEIRVRANNALQKSRFLLGLKRAKAGDVVRIGHDNYELITENANGSTVYKLILPPELKKQIDTWAKGPRTSNVELEGTIEQPSPEVKIFKATKILDNRRMVNGKPTNERRKAGLHDIIVSGDFNGQADLRLVFQLFNFIKLGPEIKVDLNGVIDTDTLRKVLEKDKGIKLLAFLTSFDEENKQWTTRFTFQTDMARKEFQRLINHSVKDKEPTIVDTDEDALNEDWLGNKISK
jgi:hypothetical protein